MNANRYIFALGFFDGVHLGHRALLQQCCLMARQEEAIPAAITFDRHPQSLFVPDPPPLINSNNDRDALLTQFGISHIVTLPVTAEVMSTDWQDFLLELCQQGAVGFVCGDDFRFGRGGLGDAAAVRRFCAQRCLPCSIVPEQTLESRRISSTHIRFLLEQGRMADAVKFLGHPHLLSGRVIPGQQLGRTLGIPTANLQLPEAVVCPKLGVYACRAVIDGNAFPAVTNIGTRPTVSGQGITVEPWILDFDGDLYGREISLEFFDFLRDERKFDSLEALRAEILHNAQQTRRLLG